MKRGNNSRSYLAEFREELVAEYRKSLEALGFVTKSGFLDSRAAFLIEGFKDGTSAVLGSLVRIGVVEIEQSEIIRDGKED